MSSRSLIVLPDDAATPILEAIGGREEVAPRQDVRLLRPRPDRGGHRRAAGAASRSGSC